MTVLDFPPRPRMSTIVKRADFAGYGFNLHAEKNKPGIQIKIYLVQDRYLDIIVRYR